MRQSTTERSGAGAGDGTRSGDGRHRGGSTRRQFLGTAATLVAGGVTASTLSDRVAAATFPRVTTRGHFEIDGSWWSADEVYLTDGHSKYDYDVEGTIPGYNGGSAEEILVWVHGWRNDASEAISAFEEGRRALRNNGYDAPVVGFSYDADTGYTDWWQAYEIAERNGYKLAAFVDDYRRRSGANVRIACHSLGGKVTMSTCRVLANAGATNAVESASLLGAAVHNDECARSGKYGPGAARAARQVDNYWMDGDDVLQWAFGIAEADGAVGETGVEGTTPSNWEDHQVYVGDHFSYPEPGEGCVGQVVSEF